MKTLLQLRSKKTTALTTAFLMNPFFFVTSFFAHFGDVFFEAFFGFFEWLKKNDFSGTQRRKRYLAEAPTSFEADQIPVVLGADQFATLVYDTRGSSLKNRTTGKTSLATPRTLRRFSRRGMKGVRTASFKLAR